MSEYNLGTAHGQIVVEYDDRAIQQAERSFQQLEKISSRLDKALSGARRMAVNVGKGFIQMNGGVKQTISNLQQAGQAFQAFSTLANAAINSAAINSTRFWRLWDRVKFRAQGGFGLYQFTKALLGMAGAANTIPPAVQKIMALVSAIQLLKIAPRIFMVIGQRLGIFAALSRALGLVQAGFLSVLGPSTLLGARMRTATTATRTFARTMGAMALSAIPALRIFPQMSVGIRNFLQSNNLLGQQLRNTGNLFSTVFRNFDRFGRAFSSIALGVFSAIGAYRSLKNAVMATAKYYYTFIGALTATIAAVRGLGTVLLGLVDAVKQLGGGFAILPGIIAIALSVMATLKLGLKGVGDAFSALADDDMAKFDEAVNKLAPNAKGVMNVFRDFKDVFKELQLDVQNRLFANLEQHLRSIAGPVLATLRTGTGGVADGLNQMAQQFLRFLSGSQTLNDLQSIFRSSEGVVRNLASALQPALRGLMDFATVGAEVFEELTDSIGLSAAKFETFAREARENGSIRQWILDAVQGFRDLREGISNVGQGLGSILRAFGASGDNGLERFNAATERFKHFVAEGSAFNEVLTAFIDRMRNLAETYGSVAVAAWEALGPSIQQMLPILDELVDTIAHDIVKALGAVGPLIGGLVNIIDALSDPLVLVMGHILGFVIMTKTVRFLTMAFAPLALAITAVGKALQGVSVAWAGFKAQFVGLTAAAAAAGTGITRFGVLMGRFGRFLPFLATARMQFQMTNATIQTMATSMGIATGAAAGLGRAAATSAAMMSLLRSAAVGVTRVFSGMLALVGGPLGAAIIALTTGIMLAWDAASSASDGLKMIEDQAKETDEAMEDLVQAFKDANGEMSKDVFAAVGDQIKMLRKQLDEAQEHIASGWDKLGAGIATVFTAPGATSKALLGSITGNSEATQNALRGTVTEAAGMLDELGRESQESAAAIDALGWSQDQLALAVGGTDAEYQSLINSLNTVGTSQGIGVTEAIEDLNVARDRIERTKTSFEAVGPMGTQLAGALRTIANEASTAEDRLNAMTLALEALGVLETTADAAAFNLAASIREITDEVTQLAVEGDTEPIMLSDGRLNGMSRNAQILRDKLSEMGTQLKTVAAEGGNIDEAMANISPVLAQLSEEFQVNIADIERWGAQLGIAPRELKMVASVSGADEATLTLQTLQLQLDTMGEGTHTIPMRIESAEALQKLQDLNLDVKRVTGADEFTYEITADTRQVAEAVAAISPMVDQAGRPIILGANADLVFTTIEQIHSQLEGLSSGEKVTIPIDQSMSPEHLQAITAQLDAFGIAYKNVVTTGANGQAAVGLEIDQSELADVKFAFDQIESAKERLAQGLSIGPVTSASPEVQQYQVKPLVEQPPPVQVQVEVEDTPVPAPPANVPPVQVPVELQPEQTPSPQPPANVPPVQVPVEIDEGQANNAQQRIQDLGASLQDIPRPEPIIITVDATGAVVSIQSVNEALATSQTKWSEYKNAIQTALNEAKAAIEAFAGSIPAMFQSAIENAENSGRALGQGFADGILDKVDEARAAATALAEAAADPLPRSPAKTGPFSGSGWTPNRGRKLAIGFAEGIYSGSGPVADAANDMMVQISKAMDVLYMSLGGQATSFSANRAPGASGKRFYRDSEQSNEELAAKRMERAAEAQEKAAREQESAANRLDRTSDRYSRNSDQQYASIQEMADAFGLTITSNQRNEPGSFHNTGEAWDISGAPEDMMALNQYLARVDPNARELFYDPGTNIDEGTEIGAIGGHSDHLHYVPSDPSFAQAVGKGTATALSKDQAALRNEYVRQNRDVVDAVQGLDAEQTAVAQAIIAEGRSRNLHDADIIAALETGIVESDLRNLNYGDRDSQGVFQQRPSQGWGDPGSVEEDTKQFYDALASAQGITPGQRAQEVQRSAFPEKYDQQQERAISILESLDGTTSDNYSYLGSTDSNTAAAVDELRHNNKDLDTAIRVAQDPSSSDAQVIQSLQTIADNAAMQDDEGIKQELEGVQNAIMEDRGIKEYDPMEGASDNPLETVKGMVENVFSLYKNFKEGSEQIQQLAELLVRGFSSTKDITTFIDGVQGIASTIGDVISTVGQMISAIASLAALASFAIPGVGQVTAAMSAVSGGIGQVNGIIDLIQEGFDIAGTFVGTALSLFAGGSNGMFYGNVRTLMDFNDNTIKTWSDRNPGEKTVRSLSNGGEVSGRDPNQAGKFRDLNIYTGPGSDPRQMMEETMFAVAAHSDGVWSG